MEYGKPPAEVCHINSIGSRQLDFTGLILACIIIETLYQTKFCPVIQMKMFAHILVTHWKVYYTALKVRVCLWCDIKQCSCVDEKRAVNESEGILVLGLAFRSSPASCSSRPLAKYVRGARISLSHLTMLDPNTYLLAGICLETETNSILFISLLWGQVIIKPLLVFFLYFNQYMASFMILVFMIHSRWYLAFLRDFSSLFFFIL